MGTTVAYITGFEKPSGAGSHAQTVMEEVGSRDGIDLYAVNTKQTGYPETYYHEPEDASYTWAFPNHLADTLEEIDPDVGIVHVYNTHLFDALREIDEDLHCRWYYRHGTNMAEQWFSRAQGRPLALSALKSIIWDLDWFEGILCPTETVANRIQLYYGDSTPNLYVIPNALDLHEFTPTTYHNEDDFKIVLAGRIAPVNYAPLPLLAIRRLIEDHDIECRVFGAGHERLQSSIERVIGDAQEIEMMGHVDRRVVIANLEQADIAVCPTISQNAVPYSALEALASGCLTIASDCAAIREEPAIIRCSHEDPTQWYTAIEDACTDIDGAKEFVRNGLQAVRNYSVDRIVTEGYMPVIKDETTVNISA